MMILGSISSSFLFLHKDFLAVSNDFLAVSNDFRAVSNDLFFKISYFFEFP